MNVAIARSLARSRIGSLCLGGAAQSPEYIAVHEKHEIATPVKLSQQYAVVELQHKIDVMWSFVCSHRQTKSIIFLATCKQVRFCGEGGQGVLL